MLENALKINYKKSPIKKGNEKTLLFEVISPWEGNVFFFTDRSRYKELKENPSVAIEIVRTTGRLSKVIEKAYSTPTSISVTYQGLFRNKTSLVNQG